MNVQPNGDTSVDRTLWLVPWTAHDPLGVRLLGLWQTICHAKKVAGTPDCLSPNPRACGPQHFFASLRTPVQAPADH